MRELLTSPRVPAPRFRYTPCVRVGAVGFVSGMVGLDPATGALVTGGLGAQTQRIFDNLDLALPDYGFAPEQLSMARVFVTRFDDFEEFNAVWDRRFARTPPPARTSVGVTALPLGAQVEIEFIFHRG